MQYLQQATQQETKLWTNGLKKKKKAELQGLYKLE